MNELTAIKGDTGTPIDFTVGDVDGPIALTGATIKLRYAVAGVVTEKTVSAHGDQTTYPGRVYSYWGATDLDSVAAGEYPCQSKITFSDGKVRYFPLHGYNVLKVSSPL